MTRVILRIRNFPEVGPEFRFGPRCCFFHLLMHLMVWHLEPILKPESFVCPACLGKTQMTSVGEDTLFADIAVEQSLWNAGVLWGVCASCSEELYQVKISIASNGIPHQRPDNRYLKDARSKSAFSFFWANPKKWTWKGLRIPNYTKWELQHHVGVPYGAGQEVKWVDCHLFPAFHQLRFDPFVYAQGLAHKMIPQLVAAKLWD